MNFLDNYDIGGQTTPNQQNQEPGPSLNEEVSEVIGQLGRFWGGFRKQSQNVLETARKDLNNVVVQAQREFTKLTEEPSAAASPESTAAGQDSDISRESVEQGSTEPSTSTQEANSTASTSTSTPTSLFSRLQAALPPNLLESARNQLPESLRHASEQIDLPHLRANFVSEFQRVQGVTRAQAEEYAHKSEALIREAVKEAGDVLRDAVKIIPPEESTSTSGLVWDGSDMWSLPMESSSDSATQSSNPSASTSKSAPQHRHIEAQRAVATRAEFLLRRLKLDPAIIRHDPATDVEELYSTWAASEFTAKGGIEEEHCSSKINGLLNDPDTGNTLKATRDTLVPSELSETEFWKRFFFRAHQIELEEKKRKALLESAGPAEEEEFSWEDDDDDTSANANANTTTTNERPALTPSSVPSSVARDSSEDYDLISSGNVSPKDSQHAARKDDKRDDTSDADSDWE